MMIRKICLATCLSLLASGCSYSTINPEGARAAMMKFGGEAEFGHVSPDKSKLVFRVMGDDLIADFQLSDPNSCETVASIGKVMDGGHQNVYPWVAAIVQKRNEELYRSESFRAREIGSDKPLRVQASGININLAPGSRNRICEPEGIQFLPEPGKAYEVLFMRATPGACRITVMHRDGNGKSEEIKTSLVKKCPIAMR